MIIHSTHYLFSDWPKAYSEFSNQCLGRHLAADYTIIMSRTLKVTGNHVMYDRGAWFLRVIMSSLRALCCLPSVKKQNMTSRFASLTEQDIEKSSWRQGLTNTKRSTKVAKELFSDSRREREKTERTWGDNPYLDLDYSGYHKNLILTNNCLLTNRFLN